MKASLPCPAFWPRLVVALGGVVLLGFVTTAEGRLYPRVAAVASVAPAAEFDALAVGDNLRTEERAFLRSAVESFRQQARLAQLGVAQAASSELRTFAQDLVTDTRTMGDAVEAVARRKGVVLVPTSGAPNPGYARLAEMGGEAFDREFVLTAAAHIDEMVKLFDYAVANAKDADVRDLAGSQLANLRTQSNAIVTLRKAHE